MIGSLAVAGILCVSAAGPVESCTAQVDTAFVCRVHRVSFVNSIWETEFRFDTTINDTVFVSSSTRRGMAVPPNNKEIVAVLRDLRYEPFGVDTVYSLLCMSGEHNEVVYVAGTDSLVLTFRSGNALKATIAGFGHRATLTKSATEVLEAMFHTHLGVDLWGSEKCR